MSADHEATAPLVAWPGPDPAAIADGFALSATTPHPGIVVVRAIGEIDMLTAPGWARTLDAAVRILAVEAPHPANRLVCDLSSVTFLGASGLAVLVGTAADAAREGLGFRVVADHRAVCRPLRLTGLHHRFPVDAQLVDAVERDL